jgi:DNA-binding MarR family transcriptional regulator
VDQDIVDTWELLMRFHRRTTRAMDEHLQAEFGRSLDEYDALHQIRSHDGPVTMGELADRLLVAKSSCNRLVSRLVDDGLVERSAGASDRREVRVALTPDGRRLWRRMAAVHARDIERHLGDPLSGRRRRELDAIVRDLS